MIMKVNRVTILMSQRVQIKNQLKIHLNNKAIKTLNRKIWINSVQNNQRVRFKSKVFQINGKLCSKDKMQSK